MTFLTKNRREFKLNVTQLVARAWTDEKFKQRLIADPGAVLAENDLILPAGITVRVNESASIASTVASTTHTPKNTIYEILLPPTPVKIKDSQLQTWVDGDSVSELIPVPGAII